MSIREEKLNKLLEGLMTHWLTNGIARRNLLWQASPFFFWNWVSFHYSLADCSSATIIWICSWSEITEVSSPSTHSHPRAAHSCATLLQSLGIATQRKALKLPYTNDISSSSSPPITEPASALGWIGQASPCQHEHMENEWSVNALIGLCMGLYRRPVYGPPDAYACHSFSMGQHPNDPWDS